MKTTVTKATLAAALTIIAVTGALAAQRYHPRVYPTDQSAAAFGGGMVPIAPSPEEEALFDPAKGFPQGY